MLSTFPPRCGSYGVFGESRMAWSVRFTSVQDTQGLKERESGKFGMKVLWCINGGATISRIPLPFISLCSALGITNPITVFLLRTQVKVDFANKGDRGGEWILEGLFASTSSMRGLTLY